MNRKNKCKLLAWIMIAALTITASPSSGMTASAKTKSNVSTKWYTISKKPGTYQKKVTLKVTAKKGSQVYYTTNGTFRLKKKLSGGKSKKITITKTTKLSLYAVSKETKVTAKQLKNKKLKKNSAYASYTYKITSGSSQALSTPKASAAANSTAAPKTTQTPSASGTPAGTGTFSSKASASPAVSDTAQTPSAADNTSASTAPGTAADLAKTSSPEQTADPDATAVPAGTADPTASADPAASSTPSAGTGTAAPSVPTPSQPADTTLPADYDEDTAQTIQITADGITTDHLQSSSAVTYETDDSSDTACVTICEAGTYVLSGGTEASPLTNTFITVKKNTSEVNLIWDNLHIDNSALGSGSGQDSPVFQVKSGDSTTNKVTVYLKGDNVLKGNGSVYTESTDNTTTTSLPGGVIEAKGTDTVLTFASYDPSDIGSLTVTDSMNGDTTDYGSEDPSDGISSKGTLIIQSGKYQIHSNGDCLKGTGADGEGGVFILNGTLSLRSDLGNGIKSKNGNICIYDGTTNILSTQEDGINAKNYTAAISGGKLTITHCQGDGIQGEWVSISGDDTYVDITTEYENAGINYYSSSLGSGNYNTLTSNNSTKTETVNVDTGSHKGIKAGTKSSTCSYTSVADDSTLTADKTYSTEASGGLVITGGTIIVDTTQSGIKYNGGGGGMGGGSGSGAATSDGQYIIGAPDDTIHSNNTCVISGGSLTLSSADDGITVADTLDITGNTSIDIKTCYEGIEASTINIGTKDSQSGPDIVIYSNDDGINAASKSSTTYVYEDESEEKYTKTTVSSSDNVLNVYSGYINVMIADDETHTITLPVKNGNDNTITYSADGDGIDCNGSFYAYGGTIVVFGSTSNDNAPIDTDGTYYIGSGVTLLAVGSNGMIENPTSVRQAYLCTGSSNGSMRFASADTADTSDSTGIAAASDTSTASDSTSKGAPGGNGRPGGNGGGNGPGGNNGTTYSANTAFSIADSSGNVILSICPDKSYSHVLYSSPELISDDSYTLYSGGSVSGSKLADSDYDFRHESCDTNSASVISTTTAGTTIQGSNSRP